MFPHNSLGERLYNMYKNTFKFASYEGDGARLKEYTELPYHVKIYWNKIALEYSTMLKK
jgi:hypothetical protein